VFRVRQGALVVTAVVAVVAAACSSGTSGPTTTPPSGATANSSHSAAGTDITVGVLTDLTGPASAGNTSSPKGVKAGTVVAEKSGIHIKYVVGDTGSNPATALTVARKLVVQDHAQVIMSISALTFGASSWLTAHKIPVFGVAEDGPEWVTAPNMFSAIGAAHQELVATTFAKFFKQFGSTTLGSLGYGISPNSGLAAKGLGVSGPKEGLKVGYMNANFEFGSNNVQPAALAIKAANVDGLQTTVATNTSFALIQALKNLNATPKNIVLFTGYGADLLNSGEASINAAQGVYFPIAFEPVELNTAGTKAFMAARTAAGLSGLPTYSEYFAYAGVMLLIQALEGTGTANPSQAEIITSASKITRFTANGLTGAHAYNPADRQNIVNGPESCMWFTQLEGKTFKTVKGASPLCGELIPGAKVSLSQ
jgi:branched-chain amino acid transport system substrate-binding protein